MRKLLACSMALALFVPIATAGPPPPAVVDVDVAKKAGGPWTETGGLHVKVGQKSKSVFVRVTNRDTGEQDIYLSASFFDPKGAIDDYRIRWYRGNKNITDDVLGAGYGFILDADEKAKFESTLKAKKANPGKLCMNSYVEVPPNLPYGNSIYVNDNQVCG